MVREIRASGLSEALKCMKNQRFFTCGLVRIAESESEIIAAPNVLPGPPGMVFSPPWVPPGPALGPRWCLLGSFGAALGPPWRLLGFPGASLGPPGRLLGSPGAALGPQWRLLGSPGRPSRV